MAIIEVSGLEKSFGDHAVLKGIDLNVNKQDVLAVVGPSGSGKSTFLRCLNLLERPTAGTIRFEGKDITKGELDVNALRSRVGMVFQHFNLFPHMTVLNNITLAQQKVLGTSREAAVEVAQDLLAKVGLRDKQDAYPNSLSGGQKQRVAIARALALKPAVILFDEPTSALDPEMVHEVLQTMAELAAEGMTMIVVTHEMGFARRAANRLVFMDDGVIISDTTPAAFFEDPGNERARKFIEKVLS
ncbi:amino acid ABC transporter ATP-binding protein [Alicyclobacillus macrosporangiidus]|uniref:amino acid ABC transporter ATP-binding protein n=1 Tax=Alicyclobacillus macrosporangiidus TaxID=392015 RepID=UPI0026F35F42|nr:amino acid ABC transporter ATP-binding protein [Alicyclobacillus macrosporangiidus]